VSQYERNMGVIIYSSGDQFVFRTPSLGEGLDPYLALIRKAMGEGAPRKDLEPIRASHLCLCFSLQDREGKPVGGVAILQHISFVEREIEEAKRSILLTTWCSSAGPWPGPLGCPEVDHQPISVLTEGIQNIARGTLDTRLN